MLLMSCTSVHYTDLQVCAVFDVSIVHVILANVVIAHGCVAASQFPGYTQCWLCTSMVTLLLALHGV